MTSESTPDSQDPNLTPTDPEQPETTQTSEPAAKPVLELDWSKLGLSQELLKLVEQAGYNQPTEIQAEAIPAALEGRDIIASARTGSGKTACFTLPMLDKIKGRSGTQAIILAPTREIALQTFATVEQFGKPLGIEALALIGGIDYKKDEEGFARYPQVIVGTPGRIADHVEKGNLWLDYIEFAILDEADRMLDMGFANQLSQIMSACNPNRQTLFFSATFAPPVEELARRVMYDPVRIAVGKPMAAAQSVTQKLYWMSDNDKRRFLIRMFANEKDATFIVFTRSKDQASTLWRTLHSSGVYDATYISSNKQQDQREAALAGFKSGKYRMLIATDVAARGIHVENVSYVINYELPIEPEDYIHRIGRTGRKDQTGTAISLVSPGEKRLLVQIERLMKREIPAENEMPSRDGGGRDQDRGGRGGSRGGSGSGGGRDRGGRGGRGRSGGGGGGGGGRSPEPRGPEARGPEVSSPEARGPEVSNPESSGPEDNGPPLRVAQPRRPESRGPEPRKTETTRAPQPRREQQNDYFDPNEPAPWERGSTVYELPQAGGNDTDAPRGKAAPSDDRNGSDSQDKPKRRRRGGRGRGKPRGSGDDGGTPPPSAD